MEKILVISASHRDDQTLKVANYIANELQTDVLNLNGLLPLWDESAWEDDSKLSKKSARVIKKLVKYHALVVCVPEYNGMAAPIYKNFLLYVGGSMVHVPVLLVTVSGSRGGAYPISELRSSGYKNTYLNYIPEHVIIRNVEEILNSPKDGSWESKKVSYSLEILKCYAKHMRKLRKELPLDLENYPYGM